MTNTASAPDNDAIFQEPEITETLGKEHGFSPEEYKKVFDILGRTPTFTEFGIFSVMWSEHCSYKSSRLHLKKTADRSLMDHSGAGRKCGRH